MVVCVHAARQVLSLLQVDDLPASLPPLARRRLAQALVAGNRGRLTRGGLAVAVCVRVGVRVGARALSCLRTARAVRVRLCSSGGGSGGEAEGGREGKQAPRSTCSHPYARARTHKHVACGRSRVHVHAHLHTHARTHTLSNTHLCSTRALAQARGLPDLTLSRACCVGSLSLSLVHSSVRLGDEQ